MFSRFLSINLLLISMICVLACGPTEVERLEKEVLDLHDEVMPWLDDMKANRRQLLKLQQSIAVDSLEIVEASNLLHQGDSMMWHWMYQYTAVEELSDSLDREQLVEYLHMQKREIKKVNEVIKRGLETSRSILGDADNSDRLPSHR